MTGPAPHGGRWPRGHRPPGQPLPRHHTPWHTARRALTITGGTLLTALLCLLYVIPPALGGTSLTVLTGSMTPTLNPGDIIAITPLTPQDVCTDTAIGDIITYLPQPADPTLVTHRITAKTIGTFDDGTHCRLTTQGDANNTPDEPITPHQVRGQLLYAIPHLGWIRHWIQNNTQAVLLTTCAIALITLAWDTLRPPKTRIITLTTTTTTHPAAPASTP